MTEKRDDVGAYRSITRSFIGTAEFRSLPELAQLVLVLAAVEFGPAGIEKMSLQGLAEILTAVNASYRRRFAAVKTLVANGFIVSADGLTWLRFQLQNNPHMRSSDPKHRVSIQRYVADLPQCPIVANYIRAYPDWFPETDELVAKRLRWALEGKTLPKTLGKTLPKTLVETLPTSLGKQAVGSSQQSVGSSQHAIAKSGSGSRLVERRDRNEAGSAAAVAALPNREQPSVGHIVPTAPLTDKRRSHHALMPAVGARVDWTEDVQAYRAEHPAEVRRLEEQVLEEFRAADFAPMRKEVVRQRVDGKILERLAATRSGSSQR